MMTLHCVGLREITGKSTPPCHPARQKSRADRQPLCVHAAGGGTHAFHERLKRQEAREREQKQDQANLGLVFEEKEETNFQQSDDSSPRFSVFSIILQTRHSTQLLHLIFPRKMKRNGKLQMFGRTQNEKREWPLRNRTVGLYGRWPGLFKKAMLRRKI